MSQQNTTVNFKYIGSDGVVPYTMPVTDALNEITRQATEESAWIFIDKASVGHTDLTIKMLENAKDITLSPKLMGG